MNRFRYISVAHNVATVEVRYHRRNPFDLTPRTHPQAFDSSPRHNGHPINVRRLLRQGFAHRRRTLASTQCRELTPRKCSQWCVRATESHAQRESITYRR